MPYSYDEPECIYLYSKPLLLLHTLIILRRVSLLSETWENLSFATDETILLKVNSVGIQYFQIQIRPTGFESTPHLLG